MHPRRSANTSRQRWIDHGYPNEKFQETGRYNRSLHLPGRGQKKTAAAYCLIVKRVSYADPDRPIAL